LLPFVNQFFKLTSKWFTCIPSFTFGSMICASVSAPQGVHMINMAPLLMAVARAGLLPAPHGCQQHHMMSPRFTLLAMALRRTKSQISCGAPACQVRAPACIGTSYHVPAFTASID
jgi:hypothetical protein